MVTALALANEGINTVGMVVAGNPIDVNEGWTWLTNIRNFIMPFLLIAIAGISVTFLVRRQMSQFLQFIGISVLVLVLVYSPEIISNAAAFLANQTSSTTNKPAPVTGPGGTTGSFILPAKAFLGL